MRQWLKELFEKQYLPAVRSLQDTPEGQTVAKQWAEWMKQQWVEHGLTTLRQQAGVMQEVRNALKAIDSDHVALKSMKFSTAQWIAINELSQKAVARRNEHVKLIDDPEAIVAKAVRLLESRDWAAVAAGLTVLTGRRSSEILATAEFEKQSQWSVRFTGALKRKGESQRLSFEIPTLTTADRVIAALRKLRGWVNCQGLSVRQINAKYSHAVAVACDKHFSGLVPVREGEDNLYTHLFRSVYGAIAVFWYCPPTVDADEFKAQIQGHFALLDTQGKELRRSLAAGRHYNDYKIGDGKGNLDGRQGIKLGLGGIEVIEAFERKQVAQMAEALAQLPSKKQREAKVRVWRTDVERLQRCLEQLGIVANNQPDRIGHFLDWVEHQLASKQAEEPDADVIHLIDLVKTEQQADRTVKHDEGTTGISAKAIEAVDKPPVTSPSPEPTPPLWEQLSQQMLTLTRQMSRLTEVLLSREQQTSLEPGQAQTTPSIPLQSPQMHGDEPAIGMGASTINLHTTQSKQMKGDTLKPNRSSEVALEKVNAAIDQIIAYNDAPGRVRSHRIMIGVAALKKVRVRGELCGQTAWEAVIGKANAPGTRTAEIEAHHSHYGLGLMQNRSRNTIVGLPSIEDVANGRWHKTAQDSTEAEYPA